jgi:hypothetical protein
MENVTKILTAFQQENEELKDEIGLRIPQGREQMAEFGLRLSECDHFSWDVGMLTIGSARCITFTPQEFIFLDYATDELVELDGWSVPHAKGWMPDLSDNLTTAGLRECVQLKYNDMTLTTRWDKKKEMWSLRVNRKTFCSKMEGEVYALALLAK